LKGIRLRHLALLIVLTLASIFVSVIAIFGYFYANPTNNFTRVDGFQTYFNSTLGQGHVSISKESVRIEAENNTFSKAFLYSAHGGFKWNFSITPLIASGTSYPIFFSIEWAGNVISIWTETTNGWYCSSNINGSLAQNKVSIGNNVTLGSKYDARVEWKEQSQQSIATISLKNSTWSQELTFNIPGIGIAPAISIQAWTDTDAHVVTLYTQSVFLSYNSRFTEESDIATVTSTVISIFLVTITTLVFALKFSEISSSLKSHSRINAPRLEVLRRMHNFVLLYVKENKTFIYLVLFFAVFRIGLAVSSPAHWFDMYAFRSWCQVINDKGVLNVYPETVVLPPIVSVRPVYPYPPIIAYILSLIVQAFPTNGSAFDVWPIMIKLPPIFAELVLGWVTFTAVKRWKGYRAGLIAATLSMLNFVNSSIWGQYESVVALFMVLAVWLIITKHAELGWLFAALAVGTKETALPFLPGLLIVSVKRARWFHTLLGIGTFCLTSVVVWTPFLLSGYSLNFALWQLGFGLFSPQGAFTPASSEITRTTVDALNIWPVINWLKDGIPPRISILATVSDSKPNQFLFLSYYQLGTLLFVIFYGLILYSLRKEADDQSVMIKFSLLMFVFYMFPTRMHERYMYFALPFLALAYGARKSATVLYALLLTTFSLSLVSALSFQWTPPDVFNVYSRLPSLGDFGNLFLSLINISVLIMMLYQLIPRDKVEEVIAHFKHALHFEDKKSSCLDSKEGR
jgi:Gpi18-like mannosyltransferase